MGKPEAGGPGKGRKGQRPSSLGLLSLTHCSSHEADMAVMGPTAVLREGGDEGGGPGPQEDSS